MQNAETDRPAGFRGKLAASAFGLALTATALVAAPLPSLAAPIIGVVGGNLVGFDSAAPSVYTQTLAVTGLGGEVIRGIDTRPATGQLYALGGAGNLFTIDLGTGAATRVGSVALPINGSDFDFGFAFNPMVDRIRTVSASDKNLRTNPVDATTLVDTNLAYAAGDVNAGRNPAVTGAAYTNQVAGALTTMLYGIDAQTSSLVLQNPPNNGTLNTVGSLGVQVFGSSAPNNVGTGVGFDIDPTSGIAYASFINTGGQTALYTINLMTGAATSLGGFGASGAPRDIAVGTLGAVAVPEPASLALLGVGLTGLIAARRRRRTA